MTRRITMMLPVLVLVASACADGGTSTESATTVGDDSAATTTAAAAVEESTTTTAATPATTTTVSVDSESTEIAALRAAFAASADVTSGRMEGSVEISGLDASEGLAEIVVRFGGSFDNESGDYSFFMDRSGTTDAADDKIRAEFGEAFGETEWRLIGETAYVKFSVFFQGATLGADTPWVSGPADEIAPTGGFSMTFPGNPSEILGSYEDAGATVEVIGDEAVNGVNATRYRVVFDTESLLAEATPEELERLKEQGPIPIDELPMDVWISEDGLVVRFIMEIDGDSIETETWGGFEHMSMRYDMFELNSPIVIEPPPADEVTDFDDLGISFELDD